jgi:hypothetical protein
MTMSIDGTWTIVVESPMGEQKSTVELKIDGNALTGTSHGPNGDAPIADGKADGNDVSWKLDITQPMPMTLEVSGTVDGNSIAGRVKAGMFGSFPFTGTRT